MRKLIRGIVIVAFLSTWPMLAVADTGGEDLSEGAVDEIDDEDIERAQEAFNKGATLYYEGEYGQAMVEFRRAHETYPHPVFAHNIALANRQLGRQARTLDAAEEARNLDRQAREQGRSEDALPDRAVAVNDALTVSIKTALRSEDIAGDIEGARAVAAEDETDVDQPPAVDEPSSWGAKGWGGVASLVVGVGALTGAALIDRNIVSGIEELENWDGTSQEFDEELESLESQQSTGRLLLFSGAGFAALGAGLVVWELMSSPDSGSQMAVAPSIERPGVNVMFRW